MLKTPQRYILITSTHFICYFYHNNFLESLEEFQTSKDERINVPEAEKSTPKESITFCLTCKKLMRRTSQNNSIHNPNAHRISLHAFCPQMLNSINASEFITI